MLNVGAQHVHRALLVTGLAGENIGLLALALLTGIVVLHPLRKAVVLFIQRVLPGLGLLLAGLGGGVLRLEAVFGDFNLFQPLHPQGDFQCALLVPQQEEPPGSFRLLPQRIHLELQLADLIIDAHQVLLGPLELPLGLLLAVAEFGNARLPAQTGIHEQLVHVLQTDGLLIDIVFTVPAAVIPAGDHNLAAVNGGEDVGAVVQHQRHLGKAHGAPLLCAAEDHVLHFVPPKAPDGLLPHDPADSVGNIGLAGPVGSHDGGDVLAKIQYRFIRKGLEALDLKRF